MRLPDPFTHPGAVPGFQTASLIDNDPVVRDPLPNGKVNEVKMYAQYWGVEISFPDLYEGEYRILTSFIQEYKRTGTFIDVLLPQYEKFRVRGNTDLLKVQSGLKGSQLVITNVSSVSGVPQIGDLVRLSTHPKVYQISSLVTDNTKWTINVYPDLFITTTGSEKLQLNGITFQTKITNANAFGKELNADGVYSGLTLSLREAL